MKTGPADETIALARDLFASDPARAAISIGKFPPDVAGGILTGLAPSDGARLLELLSPSAAAEILENIAPANRKRIVPLLEPPTAARIFQSLSAGLREPFLDGLPERAKRDIADLLAFPNDSAGSLMSANFLALSQSTTVKDAIDKVRTLAKKDSSPSYTYVVDDGSRLVGILTMRDLLISGAKDSLATIMRPDVFAVNGFAERSEVAAELSRRKYFAAPVVDNEGVLLGVIRADQLISSAQEEASEEIQRLFGVAAGERVTSTIGFSLKQRSPWLHVNLLTAFLAAAVVATFEDVIARVTVLAVFLPIVAGQGGNAGAQSLAVVMRGIVMREIPEGRAWRIVGKEMLLGALNGISTGIVTGFVAWWFYGSAALGVITCVALIVNLMAAGASGAGIPLAMKKIGLDPAQSSSILLTTVTDVVGFLAFLGLAALFRDWLV